MAAPDAPTITLALGPEPNSLVINAAAVTDAVKYTVYWHGKTGVGKAGTNAGEKSAGVPDITIYDLHDFPKIFVKMTATNVGGEESVDSSEVSRSSDYL